MTETNFFKSDLRELEFALFEQFRLADLFAAPPYSHINEEDARLILKEAHHFAKEVMGPTQQVADEKGCIHTPEGVKAPEELKAVWNAYYENGWNTLTIPEKHGGQGAPFLLGAAVMELFNAANCAFNSYPGLTNGAAGVIRGFGSPEQRELFLTNLENGKWGGTMVLTETNAGSDVGLSTTRATPNPDGTFLISGNKIFISGGDHDLTENIVHLVLARIEGARRGTRGLSLFIVPKITVNPDGSLGEPNDVVCTRIEHKLGINGSATAALAFGEKGKCTGYLLGGPRKEGNGSDNAGEGMERMFAMMNGARIAVGLQSLGVASTAYLNALSYARTRRQGAHFRTGRPAEGAVPIIEHPDVRRMLLEMKALVEGCRALIYFTVQLQDRVAALANAKREEAAGLHEYFALFIPLVKSFVSDTAVQVASLAIQVYGGAGYTKDFPAEQYLRDARIFPIYEGTNGIQALDLVGRKLAQNGGAEIGRFTKENAEFLKILEARKGYEAEAKVLKQAADGFNAALVKYMEFLGQDKREVILLTATRFLDSMSRLLIARLLLEGALTAEEALGKVEPDSQDDAFYRGKIATGRYFARNLLPAAIAEAQVLASGDMTAMEIPDAGFSVAY